MIMKKIAMLTAAVIAASMMCYVPVASAEAQVNFDEITIGTEESRIVTQELNAEPWMSSADRDFFEACETQHGQDELSSIEENFGPKTMFHVDMHSKGRDLWKDTKDRATTDFYSLEYGVDEFDIKSKSDAVEVYHTFLNDYPQFYFLAYDPKINDAGVRVTIRPEYMSVAARQQAQKEMTEYVTSTAKELNELDTVSAKAKALHDKIVNNTELVADSDLDAVNTEAYSVMGVIREGKATADAYARTYQMVLNYMHIDNFIAEGKTADGKMHVWNLVRLDDDKYYYVDCAADDAEGTNKYLFAGSDTMADRIFNSPSKSGEDHIIVIPDANKTDYNGTVVKYELPAGFDEDAFIKKTGKRYGYDFLGTQQNGENMQKFYEALYDTAVEWWYREDNTKQPFQDFNTNDYGVDNAEASCVLICLLGDNPQFFYLSDSARYLDGVFRMSMLDDYMYADYRKNTRIRIINYMLETAPEMEKMGTDYEKVLYYHDKLVDDCEYDHENTSRKRNHNVVGAMLEGITVCEGFAHAFDMMMNYVGVDSLYVRSPGHAWNMVKLDDGVYYYLDVTGDDNSASKMYFCVGVDSFAIGAGPYHTPYPSEINQLGFLYALPEGSKTDFDPSTLKLDDSSKKNDPESSKTDDSDSSKKDDSESSKTDDSDSSEKDGSKPDDSDSERKLGDVNGDKKIDIEDAVMVIGHVNGTKALTNDESKAADIDGNKKIDIEDAVRIIGYVNGVNKF